MKDETEYVGSKGGLRYRMKYGGIMGDVSYFYLSCISVLTL